MDWNLEDSFSQVVVSSGKEFVEEGEKGAGLGIMFQPLKDSRYSSLEEFWDKYINREEIDINEPAPKELAGEEWLWSTYKNTEENAIGEVFLIKKFDRIYFIATAFHPPEVEGDFKDKINIILSSMELFLPEEK
jgi:hypothetical protein